MAHRSWCAEVPGNLSNERLEFLGDAVLGLVLGASALGGEDGGTELLLAQPVGRGEVLLGPAAARGIATLARAVWSACEAWGQGGPLRLNVTETAHRSHAVTALPSSSLAS